MQALFHGVTHIRSSTLATDFFNNRSEDFAVLATLDRINICADQFNIELLKNAVVVQRHRRVERSLTTKCWKQRIWALLLNDACDDLWSDRLDVSSISEFRVGHDGRRVAVHQDDSQALGLENATSLGARVIKLACLTNHDRARTDDHN